jgi:hypothetical protein
MRMARRLAFKTLWPDCGFAFIKTALKLPSSQSPRALPPRRSGSKRARQKGTERGYYLLAGLLFLALIPRVLPDATAPERAHFVPESAYWVWHRPAPLAPAEDSELRRQAVGTLFWRVGELEIREGEWTWKAPPLAAATLAPGFRVVPVVRLASEAKMPFTPDHVAGLARSLRIVAAESGEIQIDFDCPDRLLDSYASALRGLRSAVPRISITALSHWPRLPGFAALSRSVDEIMPMFYDMQADPTGAGPETPPPPILDPAQVETALRTWSACPIPWRAGLPVFARLTVFDSTGLSRGQIPNWSWDDFCFHKDLRTLAPTRLGVTLFRAVADARVAAIPVKAGEIVVSRFTDRSALAQTVLGAAASGAKGIVFFRLPDDNDPAGASLRDLGALASAGHAHLILRQSAEEQLELVNDSPFDLPPRLSGGKGDRDRGYALEIDAPAPVFREALAGDFWRVAAHANPEAEKPTPTLVPLATRLTFWFSQLRAGASLRTGLLQLAPDGRLGGVRYRIIPCEGTAAWKSISLPGTPSIPP